MKTLSCSVANCQATENNIDLLRQEETIHVHVHYPIHTNEAYGHRLYTHNYVHKCIRLYTYWADANYAYILVQMYLSCTVFDFLFSDYIFYMSSSLLFSVFFSILAVIVQERKFCCIWFCFVLQS